MAGAEYTLKDVRHPVYSQVRKGDGLERGLVAGRGETPHADLVLETRAASGVRGVELPVGLPSKPLHKVGVHELPGAHVRHGIDTSGVNTSLVLLAA